MRELARHTLCVLAIVSLAASAFAASAFSATVEYNTTGTMDLPATLGGDHEGWGTHFMARWENITGDHVQVTEFGWPCGGFWAQFWYVWISDTLPGVPGTQDFRGTFVAASEDESEWPPSLYTYIDVAALDIIIPAGATMYFGYGNPGMGGQVAFNGVETWSLYDWAWQSDTDYGRTAVLQFRGESLAVGTESVTLSRVKSLYR